MRAAPSSLAASLIAGAALLLLPGLAGAQPGWDSAERSRIEAEQRDQQAQQQQQAEMNRQAAMAAQRETDAAIARQRTESTLQALDSQRRYPATAYPPPPTAAGRAALDAKMKSDGARLDALTDRLLAQSNARILAIKPASH
jgi:hypothetical protein